MRCRGNKVSCEGGEGHLRGCWGKTRAAAVRWGRGGPGGWGGPPSRELRRGRRQTWGGGLAGWRGAGCSTEAGGSADASASSPPGPASVPAPRPLSILRHTAPFLLIFFSLGALYESSGSILLLSSTLISARPFSFRHTVPLANASVIPFPCRMPPSPHPPYFLQAPLLFICGWEYARSSFCLVFLSAPNLLVVFLLIVRHVPIVSLILHSLLNLVLSFRKALASPSVFCRVFSQSFCSLCRHMRSISSCRQG